MLDPRALLILTGQHSPLIRPATARARRHLVPAAQVDVVPGTGHGPGFQCAEHANTRITAFLTATERGSAEAACRPA